MARDDRYKGTDASNIATCVREINHTIGELATRYGVVPVMLALTEVMGCSACATDSVERGASIRTLVERIKDNSPGD